MMAPIKRKSGGGIDFRLEIQPITQQGTNSMTGWLPGRVTPWAAVGFTVKSSHAFD
jgi:hypothetical protein